MKALWFFAGLLALFYVGGPLITWLTLRQRTYSTFRLVQLYEVPQDCQQFFNEFAADLAREGFRALGYLANTGAVANVSAYMASWVHDTRGQMAYAYVVIPTNGKATQVLE